MTWAGLGGRAGGSVSLRPFHRGVRPQLLRRGRRCLASGAPIGRQADRSSLPVPCCVRACVRGLCALKGRFPWVAVDICMPGPRCHARAERCGGGGAAATLRHPPGPHARGAPRPAPPPRPVTGPRFTDDSCPQPAESTAVLALCLHRSEVRGEVPRPPPSRRAHAVGSLPACMAGRRRAQAEG
jgi:hypothetical protein